METLIGIKGKDFALVAADRYAAMSIFRMTDDDDKLLKIDDNKVLAICGQMGDRLQFGEYIRKNIHLYSFRNNFNLGVRPAANFTRQQLAYYLRNKPYFVDLMMAGFDEEGAHLYWMDYLASMEETEKASHGYGSYFVDSILDKFYHPNITKEEAVDVIRKCKDELAKRFLLSHSKFIVKVIDKNGIEVINVE